MFVAGSIDGKTLYIAWDFSDVQEAIDFVAQQGIRCNYWYDSSIKCEPEWMKNHSELTLDQAIQLSNIYQLRNKKAQILNMIWVGGMTILCTYNEQPAEDFDHTLFENLTGYHALFPGLEPSLFQQYMDTDNDNLPVEIQRQDLDGWLIKIQQEGQPKGRWVYGSTLSRAIWNI